MSLRQYLLRAHCVFDTAFVHVSKNRCCSLRARFPLVVTLLVSTKPTLYLVTSGNVALLSHLFLPILEDAYHRLVEGELCMEMNVRQIQKRLGVCLSLPRQRKRSADLGHWPPD